MKTQLWIALFIATTEIRPFLIVLKSNHSSAKDTAQNSLNEAVY